MDYYYTTNAFGQRVPRIEMVKTFKARLFKFEKNDNGYNIILNTKNLYDRSLKEEIVGKADTLQDAIEQSFQLDVNAKKVLANDLKINKDLINGDNYIELLQQVEIKDRDKYEMILEFQKVEMNGDKNE